MDKVYITGHRNPDTDSIVSAMAYAALKNALGQRQYCAARLGQIIWGSGSTAPPVWARSAMRRKPSWTNSVPSRRS